MLNLREVKSFAQGPRGSILNQSDVDWPLEHSNPKLKFKHHSPWSDGLNSFSP